MKNLYIILLSAILFGFNGFAQTTAQQKQDIAAGLISAPEQIVSQPGVDYNLLRPASFDACNPVTGCFIELDSTHIPVVFDSYGYNTTPGDCDDCSTAPIAMPFTYDFCGNYFNSLIINSNGNITFDQPFATFTPVGIPNATTAIMVAPFWGDVDLRNCNLGNDNMVYLKVESNRVIVTWNEVGYYDTSCDLINTFQVVISDGTDPYIGLGNNTAFYYKDMQWTTGDASQGTGGFGGANAVVGINNNDGVLFDLIGEFNFPGNTAPQINSAGSVTPGEVDWLDFQCFEFAAGACGINVCTMNNLAVVTQCDGFDYDALISFGVDLPVSTQFLVDLDSATYGPFDYNAYAGQLSFAQVDGIGLPGDSVNLTVYDAADPNCFIEICIAVPFCAPECPSTLEASVYSTDICSGEPFDVSASVDAFLNNTILNYETANGTVIADPANVILENTTCNPIEESIIVIATCVDDASVLLTDTVDLIVYPSDISAFVTPVGGTCEVSVDIDPSCDGTIMVGTLPTINPGDNGIAVIDITYLQGNCVNPFTVGATYNCPSCLISSISTTVSACDDEDFSVELDLTASDNSASFSVEDANGNDLGTFNYADLPVNVGPFFGDDQSTYSITVIDSDDANCNNSSTFGPVDCVCEITTVTATALACDAANFMVELDVIGESVGNSFSVTDVNGNDLGSFNYADLPVQVGPFNGNGTTVYILTVNDNDEDMCSQGTAVGPVQCAVCDSENLTIEGICNGNDLATFDVYISFTGNNEYTVLDGDGNVYLTGITAGQDIFVGAFPNMAEVDIIVSDDFVPNCEITESIDCVLCDPSACNSVGGTIMASETSLCPGAISIVDADDFLLMPKQSVYYLYHSKPNVTLTDLPDLSSEVFTTGSFFINDENAAACGQTIYVTAFGAMEDHNLAGFPNFNDVCLTISNTIAIDLLCEIEILVDEDCDSGSGEITFNIDLVGGLPGINGIGTYDAVGNYFTGTITYGNTTVVGPIEDDGTFDLMVTDGNGCTASESINFICEKLPITLISFTGEATEEGNLLNWVTGTEINNDFFNVESSVDGKTFKSIATINGAGDSNAPIAYKYLDANASNGLTYYRIKQTDFDGAFDYTFTIVVNRGNEDQIAIENIYPQPANTQAIVQISSSVNEVSSLNVLDITGKQVIAQNLNLSAGINNVTLALDNLSAGVYFLNVVVKDKVMTEKLIVE